MRTPICDECGKVVDSIDICPDCLSDVCEDCQTASGRCQSCQEDYDEEFDDDEDFDDEDEEEDESGLPWAGLR